MPIAGHQKQHKLHDIEIRVEVELSEASKSQPGLPLIRFALKSRSLATAASQARSHQSSVIGQVGWLTALLPLLMDTLRYVLTVREDST